MTINTDAEHERKSAQLAQKIAWADAKIRALDLEKQQRENRNFWSDK